MKLSPGKRTFGSIGILGDKPSTKPVRKFTILRDSDSEDEVSHRSSCTSIWCGGCSESSRTPLGVLSTNRTVRRLPTAGRNSWKPRPCGGSVMRRTRGSKKTDRSKQETSKTRTSESESDSDLERSIIIGSVDRHAKWWRRRQENNRRAPETQGNHRPSSHILLDTLFDKSSPLASIPHQTRLRKSIRPAHQTVLKDVLNVHSDREILTPRNRDGCNRKRKQETSVAETASTVSSKRARFQKNSKTTDKNQQALSTGTAVVCEKDFVSEQLKHQRTARTGATDTLDQRTRSRKNLSAPPETEMAVVRTLRRSPRVALTRERKLDALRETALCGSSTVSTSTDRNTSSIGYTSAQNNKKGPIIRKSGGIGRKKSLTKSRKQSVKSGSGGGQQCRWSRDCSRGLSDESEISFEIVIPPAPSPKRARKPGNNSKTTARDPKALTREMPVVGEKEFTGIPRERLKHQRNARTGSTGTLDQQTRSRKNLSAPPEDEMAVARILRRSPRVALTRERKLDALGKTALCGSSTVSIPTDRKTPSLGCTSTQNNKKGPIIRKSGGIGKKKSLTKSRKQLVKSGSGGGQQCRWSRDCSRRLSDESEISFEIVMPPAPSSNRARKPGNKVAKSTKLANERNANASNQELASMKPTPAKLKNPSRKNTTDALTKDVSASKNRANHTRKNFCESIELNSAMGDSRSISLKEKPVAAPKRLPRDKPTKPVPAESREKNEAPASKTRAKIPGRQKKTKRGQKERPPVTSEAGEFQPSTKPGTQRYKLDQMEFLQQQATTADVASDDLFACGAMQMPQILADEGKLLLALPDGQLQVPLTPSSSRSTDPGAVIGVSTPIMYLAKQANGLSAVKTPIMESFISPGNPLNACNREQAIRHQVVRKKASRKPLFNRLEFSQNVNLEQNESNSRTSESIPKDVGSMAQVIGENAALLLADSDCEDADEDNYFEFE